MAGMERGSIKSWEMYEPACHLIDSTGNECCVRSLPVPHLCRLPSDC